MANGGDKDVKVSREGVVLIKSFEGFRPRAERLEDGRWVIGYGHTRSAREGATVGEGDAELLLQYDLIPVVAAIRDRVSAPLNQHQIDALASYALSVGVEAFATSAVVSLLNAGRADEAGAMLSRAFDPAPDHAPGDPLARRRAAEGALFRHPVDGPVALATLLTAPAAEGATPSALADAKSTARAEALAHLLGEPTAPPTFDPPSAPASSTAPEGSLPDVAIAASPAAPDTSQEALVSPTVNQAPAPAADPAQAVRSWRSGVDLTVQRYSAYPQPPLGPLPLGPIGLAPVLPTPTVPAKQPVAAEVRVEQAAETEVDPAAGAETDPLPETGMEAVAPSPEPADPVPVAASDLSLVLTPPPEVEFNASRREVWPETRRHAEIEADEAALFGDDLEVASSLQVLRAEDLDSDASPRFDWSETGAFLGMGGVGLAAFGASIAGFRMAQDQIAAEAFNQTTLVSWVLALIGALCVGVSAFNLYLRWGRRTQGERAED